MEVILMDKVSFSFKNGQKILDNFSFTVKKGEFCYIKGPNGSGKSTLLKILCGLIPLKEGKVNILGVSPHKSPEVLRKVGIVIDGMGLYKELSLRDNILFFSREKGLFENEIKNEIDKYDKIWNIDFDSKYKNSSHGMRKIAKLTLSLVNNPEILIWDEPELALDKERIKILINLLEKHKNNGGTCVLAGTNPEFFGQLVDKVVEKEVII